MHDCRIYINTHQDNVSLGITIFFILLMVFGVIRQEIEDSTNDYDRLIKSDHSLLKASAGKTIEDKDTLMRCTLNGTVSEEESLARKEKMRKDREYLEAYGYPIWNLHWEREN